MFHIQWVLCSAHSHVLHIPFPAGIYLLKVDKRNSRTRCEICLKLTIKTPERRQWPRSGVFIVNFEYISHLVLLFLLLTLNMWLPAGFTYTIIRSFLLDIIYPNLHFALSNLTTLMLSLLNFICYVFVIVFWLVYVTSHVPLCSEELINSLEYIPSSHLLVQSQE